MFELCHATVVAPVPVQATLAKLAQRTGFPSVDTIPGPRISLARTAIQFFLVDYRIGEAAFRPIIKEVRSHPDETMRYAPVILVTRDGPFEAFLSLVKMGFDDVIILPEKEPILIDRLATQLNQDHLYIETEDYLGPDRRRFDMPAEGGEKRRGLKPHTRLTIHREPGVGVRVVRREFVAALAHATPGAYRVPG